MSRLYQVSCSTYIHYGLHSQSKYGSLSAQLFHPVEESGECAGLLILRTSGKLREGSDLAGRNLFHNFRFQVSGYSVPGRTNLLPFCLTDKEVVVVVMVVMVVIVVMVVMVVMVVTVRNKQLQVLLSNLRRGAVRIA